jgi:hypothetical protein
MAHVYLDKKQFIRDLFERVSETKNISTDELKKIYLKNFGKDSERIMLNIFQALYRLGIVSSKYVQNDVEMISFSDEELGRMRKIVETGKPVFYKKKDDKKEEKEKEKETIEVIFQGNLTEEALDKLLGGKILQQKRGIYKIEVPSENREKLYSLWLNSEVNNLGTVMIDVKLEKKFQEHRSKL